MTSLAANLKQIINNIQPFQRSVHILAVTKGQSIETIQALYALGLRDFGENYVNEWWSKKTQLTSICPDIRWHFIGRIQSNKINKIAQADVVHSVSKLEYLPLLAKARTNETSLEVFLQINLYKEDGRSGFTEESVGSVFEANHLTPKLTITGLMTILPLHASEKPQPWFARLAQLRDTLEERYAIKLPNLSMGMSQDYLEAIASGATWVRLGTILCGNRS